MRRFQPNAYGMRFQAKNIGLKFQKWSAGNPTLRIQDSTEALVRNIMALEQCDYIEDPNSLRISI
jgi:hypothetical protein